MLLSISMPHVEHLKTTMMLAAGRQTVDAQTKRSNNTQRRRAVSEVVDLATLAKSVPGRSIRILRATATCEILCRSQHEYGRDALSVQVREVPGVAGQ